MADFTNRSDRKEEIGKGASTPNHPALKQESLSERLAQHNKKFTREAQVQASRDAINPRLHAQKILGSAYRGATPMVQAKLEINEPGDALEQEADRMAEKVVTSGVGGDDGGTANINNDAPTIQRKCATCGKEEDEETIQRMPISDAGCESGTIQRKCADCEKEEEIQRKEINGAGLATPPGFGASLNAARGGGAPLAPSTKQEMEGKFGTDFSQVRLHTSSHAHNLSQEINAKAFTTGSDIFFNAGQLDTSSTEGKRLLAHELTHVVQQGGGSGKVQRKEGDGGDKALVLAKQLGAEYERFKNAVLSQNLREVEFLKHYADLAYQASFFNPEVFFILVDQMYGDRLEENLTKMSLVLPDETRVLLLKSIHDAEVRAQKGMVEIAKESVKAGKPISVSGSGEKAIVDDALAKIYRIISGPDTDSLIQEIVNVLEPLGTDMIGKVNAAYNKSHSTSLIKAIKDRYEELGSDFSFWYLTTFAFVKVIDTLLSGSETKEQLANGQALFKLRKLLEPHQSTLEQLEGAVSEGEGFWNTVNAHAAMDLIREFAKSADPKAKEAFLKDPMAFKFLDENLDHEERYEAYALLSDGSIYESMVVSHRIGSSGDVDIAAAALLELDISQRKEFYRFHYNGVLAKFGGHDSGIGGKVPDTNTEMWYLYNICNGDETSALKAAMHLASEGNGTYDYLLEKIIEKTVKLKGERDSLVTRLNSIQTADVFVQGTEGQEATLYSPDDFKLMNQIEARLNEIGDVDNHLLTPITTASGGMDPDSFLGRYGGEVGGSEFNSGVTKMGGESYSSAWATLLNDGGYDFEVIKQALEMLDSREQREQLMTKYDEYKNAQKPTPQNHHPVNLPGWKNTYHDPSSRPSYDYRTYDRIRNLVEYNTYQAALDTLEDAWEGSDSDEHTIITTLLEMSEDDFHKFKTLGQHGRPEDADYERSKRIYDHITVDMDWDERWMVESIMADQTPTAMEATKYGIGEWNMGWSQAVPTMHAMFDKLPDDERMAYRMGYMFTREGFAAEAKSMVHKGDKEFIQFLQEHFQQSVSAFNVIDAKLATLSDADYRAALSHLLGSEPTAREAANTPGFGGFMRSYIDKSLIEASAATTIRGSFADYFTEAREQSLTQAVHGLAAHEQGVADKVVTEREANKVSDHRVKQEVFKQETDATENMVAEVATTVVAVIVAVAVAAPTGGAGSAAVIAAALKTLSKEALLGDDYDMWGPEMWHDAGLAAVDGAAGVISIGGTELLLGIGKVTEATVVDAMAEAADFSLRALGKTVAKATLRTTIEGSMMGTFHGVSETGMDPETWRKGILDALQKMTVGGLEAGFEWAIMGAAMGGPLALAGKGITRLQVRGMTKNLHARGISQSLTTRLTPEEIVCTKWAYDLAEAGSAAEGKLLLETVTKELGAEDAAALAEGMERMGKPKAKTELPGVEPTGESAEGAGTEHLEGREGFPSKPEKDLIGQSHELPGGHKIIETADHECYLCSERCPKVTSLFRRFKRTIMSEENTGLRTRLSELGTAFEKKTITDSDFDLAIKALEKEIADAEKILPIKDRLPIQITEKKLVGSRVHYTLNSGEKVVGKLIRSIGGSEYPNEALVYQFRYPGKNGRVIDLKSHAYIMDKFELADELIADRFQRVLYADFNIPAEVGDQFSGLGKIIYEDAFAYFERSGEIDGLFGHWVTSRHYNLPGKMSRNLKDYRDAMNVGMMEKNEAAFETITGKWAWGLGYREAIILEDKKTFVKVIFKKIGR